MKVYEEKLRQVVDISKPAVEPIAAAVRCPEKPQSSRKGHRLKRVRKVGWSKSPLQNLLMGLQLNQRKRMPSPQGKIN
jgi:hypothetical protein